MKRFITLLLTLSLCLGLCAPAAAAEFSDVRAGSAFQDAIQFCAEKGILSGYADGTFQPGAAVTRAQFCVMLVRAFYPGEAEAQGKWKSTGWYAPSAAVLVEHKALPYGEKHWTDPEVMGGQITRRDMALFIANVMKDKGYSASEEAKKAAQAKITDFDAVGEYYEDAVKTVFALGIITGMSDGSFSGKGTMTRGQGAMVIYRMTQCMSAAPGTAAPVEEKQETAPTTLLNGKAPTEENVAEMMEALREMYPEGTNFAAGYAQGNNSPVREKTYPYARMRDPNTHTSNTEGCGGWSTLISDTIFGQVGFPLRKVTLAEARPSDVMVQLDENGLLVHVATITERPKVEDGKISFVVTEAATDDEDVYHLHWDCPYTWKDGGKYTYDIYTRFPG